MDYTICKNCGEKNPSDSNFCVKCGNRLVEETYPLNPNILSNQENQPYQKKSHKKMIGIIVTLAIVAVILGCVWFIKNQKDCEALQKELMKDWVRTDGTILLILDFDSNTMKYRSETGYSWIDMTFQKYEYKVTDGHTLKLKHGSYDYQTYNIEFNADKSMMTVTPAITSVEKVEYWYNFK